MTERRIDFKVIFVMALVVLAVLYTPMLWIARYDVPAADDFSFSCETHRAIEEGRGLPGAIAGAVEKAGMVYDTWQGTFSAIFMMAFQPGIWGLRTYALTTWMMLGALTGGIFFFCIRMLNGIFGVRKSVAGIVAAVICAGCSQFLPSPNQSFYWYNGAVYYTFTFAVLLVMMALVTGYILHGGWWRVGLAAVLCIVIGGSNYVTALFSCVCGGMLLVWLAIRRDKKGAVLAVPYLLLIAAFIISVAAPGNAVRQGMHAEHPGAFEAILMSFASAARNAVKWADLRYAAMMLFLVPILWAGVEESSFRFRMPGVVTGLSFCLFASMFTPHLYAMGSDGPERLKNILYFSFLIFSVLNLFWWIGWMRKKTPRAEARGGIGLAGFVGFSGAAAVSLAVAVLLTHATLASVAALSELRSGEAAQYFAEALERQKVLEDDSVKECEFSPFSVQPYILYFTDMTDDPEYYENEDTATFYGKDWIVVR